MNISQAEEVKRRIENGEAVFGSYRSKDGFTISGRIIDITESTAGVMFAFVDNFCNRVPITKLEVSDV